MWKWITRLVFMADKGAQFEVVQKLLKKVLHGKLLIFLTKQLTMLLLLWFFTPTVTSGQDHTSMLEDLFDNPNHTVWASTSTNTNKDAFLPGASGNRRIQVFLDRKLSLVLYIATACYWWACQSGLLSLHTQKQTPHSVNRKSSLCMMNNRKSLALLLMCFCLATMRM